MTSDTDPPQLPAWDLEQAAAEQAGTKPEELCAWPGCRRPRAAPPRSGRPPAYCRQTDDEHTRPHDSDTAKTARKAAEAASSPVSAAQQSLAEVAQTLGTEADTIVAACSQVREAADVFQDHDAVALELRTLRAALEREQGQRQAAEAHAAELEALSGDQQRALQQQRTHLAHLERQATAAAQRAKRATQIARSAQRNRRHAQQRLRQATRERDDARTRASEAVHERDAGLERLHRLHREREADKAHHEALRHQLQALLAVGDAADRDVAT